MALLTYSNLLKLCELCTNYPTTFLIIILSILLIYWKCTRQDYFKLHGIPHEIPTLLFGNMMQPKFGSISFVERIKKHYSMDIISRYMGFYDFGRSVILIRSTDLIRQITSTCFSHFSNHRGCVDTIHDSLFKYNLFSLRNKEWQTKRNQLCQLYTSSNIKAMYKLILRCSKNFTDHIVREAQTKPLTINSKDAFSRFTNDVMASCAFGMKVDSVTHPKNKFFVMVNKAITFKGLKLLKFFFIQTFPKLSNLLSLNINSKDVQNFFYDIVRDTVVSREASGISRSDMIQFMMNMRIRKGTQESKLTIEDMTSQAFTLFSSGFESTTSLLCFVAHLISISPIEQKVLQEEVDEVYKKYQDEPTYEAINEMKYLDAVIHETLRMYPHVPYVERICTKRAVLPSPIPGVKALSLKPGISVWIPTYALQTDRTYYPFAKEFSPERFVKNHKDIVSSFTYLPFGHGPRMCIGNEFALLITKIWLYHLISKCLLKRSDQMRLPLKLNPWSFSMSPKGGFWLDLEPRWYTKIE